MVFIPAYLSIAFRIGKIAILNLLISDYLNVTTIKCHTWYKHTVINDGFESSCDSFLLLPSSGNL